MHVCSENKRELTLERGAYRLTLPQLLLGTIKVKVNIETFYKLCDWVLICVRLLWGKKKNHYSCAAHLLTLGCNRSILSTVTCWMTLTKSLRTCLRFLTSLLVMTAVVRYRRICGHMVWMAFRYLNKNRNVSFVVIIPKITSFSAEKINSTYISFNLIPF